MTRSMLLLLESMMQVFLLSFLSLIILILAPGALPLFRNSGSVLLRGDGSLASMVRWLEHVRLVSAINKVYLPESEGAVEDKTPRGLYCIFNFPPHHRSWEDAIQTASP